jgi:uncharacterized phage protein (TIGR01671 family)
MKKREIKFKAWDGESMSKNSKTIQELVEEGTNSRDPMKLIWLEYTGLKDKSDKDVYEGDIVKSFYGVGTYTVIFKNGCFGLMGNSDFLDDWERPKNSAFSKFSECDNYKMEILGNVYENPNLINE